MGVHYEFDGHLTRYMHKSPGTVVDNMKRRTFKLEPGDQISKMYCTTLKNCINFIYIETRDRIEFTVGNTSQDKVKFLVNSEQNLEVVAFYGQFREELVQLGLYYKK